MNNKCFMYTNLFETLKHINYAKMSQKFHLMHNQINQIVCVTHNPVMSITCCYDKSQPPTPLIYLLSLSPILQ